LFETTILLLFFLCFCVFLHPSVFFSLFLHPFSVFPFPLLLVPSQSLCFSPLCLCFSIFFPLVCFVLFLPSFSLFRLSFLFPPFFFPPCSRLVEWGIYMIGEAGATLPLSNHGDKVGWLGWPLCSRLSCRVSLPCPIFIMVAGEGRELCQGLDKWGEGERGNMGAAKEGKKNLFPLPLHVREEKDIQCRSKQYMKVCHFEQNAPFHIKKIAPKYVNFQINPQFFYLFTLAIMICII